MFGKGYNGSDLDYRINCLGLNFQKNYKKNRLCIYSMDYSQNNYVEWKKLSPSKKEYILYESVYINSRKCKIAYSDRKQI